MIIILHSYGTNFVQECRIEFGLKLPDM